ncbi:uncharacterized protein LOC132630358 [Lycium barbarum]|uniref:uncharacterized protein LOC132630358 n=1 Tax=Lycium barbarum TaxID=112863 RepID=UPI00293F12E1|nr:uncharacterized protein LOC132630358 [Lycium barbarum]
MEEIGFPRRFILWILECISTVNYTILIKGETTQPFDAAKGLRQGDPISPFLLAISMEYLSRSLVGLKADPEFNFHPKCEKLGITHISFADDLLLFTRGDLSSIKALYRYFQEFSGASGLQENLGKSAVYFGGVCQASQHSILHHLGVGLGELPFKYLGIPLSTKVSILQWKPLIDKITARVSSWTAEKLSYAGRVQLVQTVLFGVQAYWAQLFIILAKVLKSIEGYCMSFIWSGTNEITKKFLVAWPRVCLPKASGGLKLINLQFGIKLQ